MGSLRTLLLAAVASASLAGAAHADVVINQGNIPGNTENVLLNPGDCTGNITGPASLIQGCLNQTRSQLVNLSTTGDQLDNQGNGQANLIAADGSFDDLTIALDGDKTFNYLIFNIDVLNGEGDAGTATFTAFLDGENPFTQTFSVRDNGQNFFTVSAINGEAMTSFLIESTVQLSNVNQIRIGGVGGGGGPVPEPGAIGLLGLGLMTIGFARRRKAA